MAAAGILLMILRAGVLMGWMGLFWFPGGFALRVPVYLTQEPVEALQWVIISEGKFARNLIKLNFDRLTNLEYKKDVNRLGVTQFGGQQDLGETCKKA